MAAEKLELWRLNPVECIKELFGNPAFKSVMRYAPEHHFADKEAKNCIYDEMWTADWWWEMQVCSSMESTEKHILITLLENTSKWINNSTSDPFV